MLDQKNIQINKEHYLTDSTGLKAMGVLDIGHIDADMAYQIAWRNSLDGTLAFQIVSGSQVRVCSNTNMWGEFSNKQKIIRIIKKCLIVIKISCKVQRKYVNMAKIIHINNIKY